MFTSNVTCQGLAAASKSRCCRSDLPGKSQKLDVSISVCSVCSVCSVFICLHLPYASSTCCFPHVQPPTYRARCFFSSKSSDRSTDFSSWKALEVRDNSPRRGPSQDRGRGRTPQGRVWDLRMTSGWSVDIGSLEKHWRIVDVIWWYGCGSKWKT